MLFQPDTKPSAQKETRKIKGVLQPALSKDCTFPTSCSEQMTDKLLLLPSDRPTEGPGAQDFSETKVRKKS